MIKSKTFELLSPTNRNVRREKNGRILVELTAKRCDKANEISANLDKSLFETGWYLPASAGIQWRN